MTNDKPILIVAGMGDSGVGKAAMAESIAEILHKHPDCIVVNSLEEAKLLGVDLEPEKERGILINSVEKFEENLIEIKPYYSAPMPQMKITHKGEQIKSARNIRREQQRKNKRK